MTKFINFGVRAKNKAFWVAFVPAVIVLIQTVAGIFGVSLDLTDLSGKIVAAIDALFVVLMLAGIVTDPTTKGFSDSERALGYETPAPNAIETVESEIKKDYSEGADHD